MSDGSWEVQQAIVARLKTLTPALAAGGVHAPAPQDQALPYVSVGESDAIPADAQCRAGLEEAISIHVWTAPGSWKPAKEIISRIRAALHFGDLVVAGRSFASATVTSTRLFPDADGKTLHGVMSVRVIHLS
ncbi:MAG TPA: DUF3168 domain-containing protein [Xanthobacteraceae bacterium]|nr:DUF3168 domain-containing protein [Xanthobacteraceae bacterium]